MPTSDRYQLVPERLIGLDVPSLVTWGNALEEIVVALQAAVLPGEKFVLVPIRNGRPVEPLTMSLVASLLPVGALGHWATDLPQPHDVPLTEALDAAVASVQVASGVLALAEQQRAHDTVVQVLEDAKQGLARSKGVIRQAPTDAVTEQIALFLDALEEELTNEESGNSTGGDIATQMLRTVTAGEQTELSIALGAVRLMALEWDIDAHAAPQLFELGE
ncbi:hypothetical protein [Kocuria atrinae]